MIGIWEQQELNQ